MVSEEVSGSPDGLPEAVRSFLDSLAGSVAVLGDDGTILSVNEAWREFAQRSGLPQGDSVEGEDYLQVALGRTHCLNASAAEGIRSVLEGENDTYEQVYPSGSDEERRLRIEVSTFELKESVYYTVNHRYVTGQEERNFCQRKYEGVVETTDDVIVTVDTTSTIRDVNSSVRDVLGYEPDELLGESLNILIPEKYREAHLEGLRQYLESGERNLSWDDVELSGRHADGSEVPLSMTFKEVSMDGDRFFVARMTDLSKQRIQQSDLESIRERFRRLTENLENVFWIVKGDYSEYEYLSPYFEELWGRPRDAFENLPEDFLETVHEDDRSRVKEKLGSQKDGDYEVEYRIRRPDGTVRWVRDRAFPITDDAGNVTRIAGISEDVTEKKEAQQRLAESEERFRQMAENMNEAFFLLGPNYQEVYYVNPAAEDIYGVPLEDLKNDPQAWERNVHPVDLERLHENMAAGKIEVDDEFRVRIDGETRWLRARIYPIFNDDGVLNKLAGIATDVTERKRAEQKSSEKAEFLNAINDRMPGVAYQIKVTTEGEFFFPYLSKGFENLAGVTAEEAMEDFQNALEHVHPDDLDDLLESIEPKAENIEPWQHDFRILHPDGTTKWIRGSSLPEIQDDGSVLFSGILIDISDRKQLERELEMKTARHELAQDLADLGHWSFTIPEREPTWSEETYSIFGLDTETRELTFEDIMGYYHPEDRQRCIDLLQHSIENNEEVTFEARITRPDGEMRHIEVYGLPRTDESGVVREMFGVVQDITARKRRQQKLERTKKHMKLALEQTDSITFEIELDTGEVYRHGEFKQSFNMEPEEIPDWESFAETVVHPDDRQQFREFHRELTEGERTSGELKYRTDPDLGPMRWIHDLVAVQDLNESSPVAIGLARDITDQKKREENLYKQTTRQALAQEIANLGHWSINFPEREVDWSDETYRIFGLDPDENSELTLDETLDYYHPDDREKALEFLNQAMETGCDVNFKARIDPPGEGRRYIEVVGSPRFDDTGEMNELFGVVQDITDRKEREEELERSRELLHQTEKLANTGGWEADLETGRQRWTPGTYQIHDLDPDETDPTVEDGIEYYHPEDQTEFERAVQKCMEEGQPFDVELRLITAEDRLRWVNTTGEPVYDSGEIVAVRGAIQDITTFKETEQALKENERRFRQMAENIESVFWLSDLDKNMLYVSSAFEDIWGLPCEEIYRDKEVFFERIHPEDRERVREAMYQDQLSGDYDEEFRIIRPDGETRWIHDRAFPVEGKNLDAPRVAGIAEDITERKHREQDLALKNRVIEESPIGISMIDPDWEDNPIVYVNQAFLELTGYDEEEVLGNSHKLLKGEESDPEAVTEIREAIEDGRSCSVEILDYRKDGSTFWNQVTLAPVRDEDDEITHYVRFNQDVTERKSMQQELFESEERFRQLAENIGEIFWMFEGDFDELLYVNEDQYREILGRDPQLLDDDPRDFLEAVHPDDRDRVLEVMRNLSEGKREKFDMRVNPREDFGRWVHVEGVPILNETGETIRITGTVRDITDRKETERALRETQERFRQLTENIDEVFWISDPDTDEMIYVSPTYECVWGRPVESLYEDPRSFLDAIHPEDQEEVEAALPDQKNGDYDLKYRVKQPDGEVRWVRDRAFPVRNEKGEIHRMVGIAEDITEMKELQREREKFVEVVEHSRSCIVRANLDREITYVNPAGLEMLGVEELEDLKGEPLKSIHPEEDHPKYHEAISAVEQGGQWHGERQYLDQSTGEVVDVLFDGFRIFDPETGEPIEYASVATDISEQIEIEEQLRSLVREKETLLQEVHHRVKNNLQVVLGLLGLQARQLENEEARGALRNSERRIQSMAMIHEKLYEGAQLSSIDFGDYVGDLLEKIAESYHEDQENLELVTDIEPTSLDPDTIISCGLIINELVSNSLQHGLESEGDPRVNVDFHTDEELNCRLIVADNGLGIDPEKLDESGSLGMRLVSNLARNQLHGELNYSGGDGLEVEVVFPPAAARHE